MSSHYVLEVNDLYKDYRAPRETLKILRGISLKVAPSEMVMIIGRSGSGKSTLLHLLGGLDKPTSGKIYFEGTDLSRLNDGKLSGYRSKDVGFVFQFYYLLPELTLLENVLLPHVIAGGQARKKEAKQLLDRVGLSHRQDHHPTQLSGGEQQRAAIARALMNGPKIVLCDEPTGNLDEETANSVFDLLLKLNREEKTTFVMVTHELSLVKRAESVYELHEGVLRRSSQN
ncbi:MAG: ABC transporter ATP-binding protein [Candidatus Omnitrophica bacterium]|nr:ABC transporter ATP-binding protein [Candidatus Omnitrophota bacterium]